MLDVAGAAQQLHKVLVVGDDQQLEVPLAGAALDDSVDSERQRTDLNGRTSTPTLKTG